jgi:nitrogen-specific signal transduction histidine kinase
MWQVVEKENYSEWALVRYYDKALSRISTEQEAITQAKAYITDRNCNNALTKDEKLNSVEVFMDTDNGIFLGVLDNKDWFLTYPKDILDKDKNVVHKKGSVVKDKKYFFLTDKTEVTIKKLPGA